MRKLKIKMASFASYLLLSFSVLSCIGVLCLQYIFTVFCLCPVQRSTWMCFPCVCACFTSECPVWKAWRPRGCKHILLYEGPWWVVRQSHSVFVFISVGADGLFTLDPRLTTADVHYVFDLSSIYWIYFRFVFALMSVCLSETGHTL